MKSLGIIFLITFLSGCSAIPQCGKKTLTVQLPSGVPFFGNAPFQFERENDHVSCDDDE